MTRVLAIDPGSEQSAWLLYVAGQPTRFGLEPNADVLEELWHGALNADVVVIEKIESYGMPVGVEVFDTVHWAGRFYEAAGSRPVVQLPRRAVKLQICGDSRAKDANIRQALIDRYGGSVATRKGGPLYGITKDVWSALAIAITYAETAGAEAAA